METQTRNMLFKITVLKDGRYESLSLVKTKICNLVFGGNEKGMEGKKIELFLKTPQMRTLNQVNYLSIHNDCSMTQLATSALDFLPMIEMARLRVF